MFQYISTGADWFKKNNTLTTNFGIGLLLTLEAEVEGLTSGFFSTLLGKGGTVASSAMLEVSYNYCLVSQMISKREDIKIEI